MRYNRDFRFKPYHNMQNFYNGCLWDWVQNTDYLLCNGFEDALPDLVQQDNIIYEYNQYNQSWSKKSCTVFSAVGAASDLFNYEFSLSEIKEIDEISYTRGRFKDSGWWVQAAVKLVADRWNERKQNKIAYYRIDVEDEELVKEILSKGYTLMTSFQGNMAYIKDYQADSILNGTDFWLGTFGHAINVRNIKSKRCCKDSAAWTDHNIYELEHTLKQIRCYSSNAYIYTKVWEDALTEVKRLNEFRTLLLAVTEANSTIRHKTKDQSYQNKLHDMNELNRKKLKDIDEQLAKYQ